LAVFTDLPFSIKVLNLLSLKYNQNNMGMCDSKTSTVASRQNEEPTQQKQSP